MMTAEEAAKRAAAECAVSGAGCGGKNPFWNPESFQFMYVPTFQFQSLPGVAGYRYTATDEQGNEHSFTAESAAAPLLPIWGELPEGVVTLRVTALDKEGAETYPVGTRTFFRLSPFPADLPPAARGYKEASARVFEYATAQKFIRLWLETGRPDPDYDRYVYPSKMIAAIISAMLDYADVCPEKAADAIKIAQNAADYLIGITATDGPMKGMPPTYWLNFREHPETRKNYKAASRINWVMMIYPPQVGSSYLALYQRTKAPKYLDAAREIAAYFLDHAEESGSWYLIRDIRTGESLSEDLCNPLEAIVPFLMAFYETTGDAAYKTLADGAIAYVEKTTLPTCQWGAQFEDSTCSVNYGNLSHYPATALIRYYAKYYPQDEEKMAKAEELMRFVEDQFVVWKRPSPWNRAGFDTALWHTPCGLEQYEWHMPIDASTSDILLTFFALYRAGRGELYLIKAKALADSLTVIQQPNGMIPTHWMTESHRQGAGLWINCLFRSANALAVLGEFLGE